MAVPQIFLDSTDINVSEGSSVEFVSSNFTGMMKSAFPHGEEITIAGLARDTEYTEINTRLYPPHNIIG